MTMGTADLMSGWRIDDKRIRASNFSTEGSWCTVGRGSKISADGEGVSEGNWEPDLICFMV
jgi:hypothetical protein